MRKHLLSTHLRWLVVLFAVGLLSTAVLPAPAASITPTINTTITIDSSDDPDNIQSRTCTYSSGGTSIPAPDGRCTLRRALIEASNRPQTDRPIAIVFDLANDDPNRNRDATGTWTIVVEDTLPPLRTQSILDINGQVVIDGDTQSGGRVEGPKILIDTKDYSLEIESENNEIRNLGLINGGAIFLKEDGNLVEHLWLGLSGDGQSIQLRTPAQPQRLATGGIFISSSDNIVRHNTIAGAFAFAVSINGNTNNNQVLDNQIGTRADGTVPAVPEAIQCLRNFNYDPANWYGGWGIGLAGTGHIVSGNRIAGLHILQAANDTPPMALEIFGSSHTIEDNIIGVDSAGSPVGVCGQGIKVSGSGTQIVDNIIVRSRTGFEDTSGNALNGAILASDSSPLFGQITVRGNIVEDGPGQIYVFGPSIPMALRQFRPARITAIEGTELTGTNGNDKDGNVSECPNCIIDFYLDDLDNTGETLVHLGSTTADANGDFTFSMSQPLASNEAVRTSSTTTSSGVIGTLGSGTTSGFSGLYLLQTDVVMTGPTTGDEDETYQFQVGVIPAETAIPISYTIAATDYQTGVVVLDSTSAVSSLRWTTPGLKTIEITVDTGLATDTVTYQIQIGEPAPPMQAIYLPLVTR